MAEPRAFTCLRVRLSDLQARGVDRLIPLDERCLVIHWPTAPTGASVGFQRLMPQCDGETAERCLAAQVKHVGQVNAQALYTSGNPRRSSCRRDGEDVCDRSSGECWPG
jgi:hypothetical protein